MKNIFTNLPIILFGVIYFGLLSAVVHCDLNYITDEGVQNGNMFPLKISVNIGEDAILKLKHVLKNQKSCLYRRTQTKELVNVVEAKGNVDWLPVESCGIRIKNVTRSDEGFWYLSSQSDDNFKRGLAYVEINDNSKSFDLREIYTPSENFAPENTRYCSVYREDSTKSSTIIHEEFPKFGECEIPNIDLDPESNGLWNVKLGLMGFTDEVNFVINVHTKQQKLVTGVDKLSNGYATLKCNIENMRETNNITFCRFIREFDKFGLNLEPGSGNNKYSYYGLGFQNGDCGLLITQPNAFDRSLWKCYVGIGNIGHSVKSPSVGAILDLSDNPQSLINLDTENVYGLETKSLDILCKSKTAIEYCWFSHPNGTAYGVSDELVDLDQTNSGKYWYYGIGFQLGHCGITWPNAVLTDSGQWKCHVGIYKKSQIEISKEIEVRVTKSNLVAKEQRIEAEVGQNLLVECSSIPKNTPLEYCRFYLPNGVGFSIDEEITSSQPLSNRYFFNPNHSLKSGYCSIIVKDVDMEHGGQWLCGAKLLGWGAESMDLIDISVVGDDLSVASIIGISFGVGILIVLVVAFVIYRRHRRRIIPEDATEL